MAILPVNGFATRKEGDMRITYGMVWILLLLLGGFAAGVANAASGESGSGIGDDPVPARTILAIGAHAGDMEVSCGAVLAKHAASGDRVVMLHLTLGERGHPGLSPDAYAEQKRREALEAAEILGAEVVFGPYRDAEIPDSEEARLYVNDVIRQVKPSHIITHWKNSIHRDHSTTWAIVTDAILLASLEGIDSAHPRHRGVRGVYFAENWEDMEGYEPYIFVDVTESFDTWTEAISRYEFIIGDISSFPYYDYYTSLARVRGALARSTHAVTFNIGAFGKRRNLDLFP